MSINAIQLHQGLSMARFIAYLSGERNGDKAGRNTPGKQPFLIAVSTDENLEHPSLAVIESVKSFDNDSLTDRAKRRLASDAEVHSVGVACFARVIDIGGQGGGA
jgi:hypothetical protein